MRPWLSAARRARCAAHTEAWLRRRRATTSRPATRCCSSATSSSPTRPRTNWDFRLIDSGRGRHRQRPHAGELERGARVGRRRSPNPPVAAAGARAAQARRGVRPQRAACGDSMDAEFQHGLSPTRSAAATAIADWPAIVSSPYSAERTPAGSVDLDRPVEIGRVPDSRAQLRGARKGGFNDPTSLRRRHLRRAVHGHRHDRGVARRIRDVRQGHAAGARGREPRRSSSAAVRETSVYAQSERLELAEHPVTRRSTATAAARVAADGLLPGTAADRHAASASSDGRAVRHAGDARRRASGDARRAMLDDRAAAARAARRDSVVVHANVALATHGETVTQILGARRREPERSSASSSSSCR